MFNDQRTPQCRHLVSFGLAATVTPVALSEASLADHRARAADIKGSMYPNSCTNNGDKVLKKISEFNHPRRTIKGTLLF